MEMVIKIPKTVVEDIQKRSTEIQIDGDIFKNAILNGIPLPKGHGALKDADVLLKYGSCPNDCVGTPTCDESYEHLHCPFRVFDTESINDTPTIIEADKEESEG